MKKQIIILFILNIFCINKGKQFDNSMDLFNTLGMFLHYLAYNSETIQLTKRHSHTATLLTNGKVLIVGGNDDTTALDSVKLYDPSSGEISTVENLNEARYEHTATLLQNGNVLIAGGRNFNNALDTTETYDPDKSTFTQGNSLSTKRTNHTASLLLDGTVLLAGGYSYSTNTDGTFSSTNLSSVDIYDLNSSSPTTVTMNEARNKHTATVLPSGQVLIVGGVDESGAYLSNSETFDTSTNTFSFTTLSLNQARCSHAASLLLNGKVLITGGNNFAGYLSSAEVYDSNTNNFSYLSNQNSMNISRVSHTSTLLYNGKVLLVGGDTSSNSSELYDPSTDSFSSISSLAISIQSHTATILSNGNVLITAGSNRNDATNNIYVYNPSSDN
ncbi:MAG: hypothetical protein H7A23_14065 [Leptospiraceae bacterium]|nr:hypothetical protein [Leptospiraceae bacterium]MCP5495675.1 hypothetical protein [Leptospiraceae bacterium]